MKRRILILVLFLILCTVVPTLATNTATITVVESSGTTYTMLPITALMNNSLLASGGFITPSGLDVLVQSSSPVPHMLVSDRTMFASPLSPNASNLFSYTTGNAPLASTYIIPGRNGYITTADDPTLELDDNFSLETVAYIDSTVNDTIIYKQGAYSLDNTAGVLTSSIFGGQPIYGGGSNALNAITEYNKVMGCHSWFTELESSQVVPTAGTLKYLRINLTAAVAVGGTYTFTIMKNGVAQTLAVTIVAGQTSGVDTTHSVVLAAGDYISIRSTITGAPGSPRASWSTFFVSTTPGQQIFMGNGYNNGAGTSYSSVQGFGYSGAETDVSCIFPTAGTISNMYVLQATAAGGGDSYAFTFKKNSGGAVPTVTITDPATTGTDLINTVALVAGDIINIQSTATGGPVATYYNTSFVFTPTIIGEHVVLGGSSQLLGSVDTVYMQTQGTGSQAWTITEANTYNIAFNSVVSKLYVNIVQSPGGVADNRVFTLRDNSGNTTLSVTISAASRTGSDTTHNYVFDTGDFTDMQEIPTDAPVDTAAHWGYVLTSEVPILSVSSAVIAAGSHTIVATATGGGTNLLGIQVDAAVVTTPLSGNIVVDTPFNWILMSNTTPYMDYYKHTVAGTLIVNYDPNAIIVGTTLPDEQAPAQDGTFTFGANPAGVSPTVGALLSSGTVNVSGSTQGNTSFVPAINPDFAPTIGNPGVNFPFYGLLKSLTDDYNTLSPHAPINTNYIWKWVAMFLAFFFGTSVLMGTRQPIMGLFAYAVGYLVPTLWLGQVLDWWVPVVYIIGALCITMLVSKWSGSSI